MTTGVGILGLGVYLPPEVRRNEWWAPELVERWMAERRASGGAPPEAQTEGERRVLQAMLAQTYDPFQGTIERFVMPTGMSLHDMEEQAAQAALAHAGIDRRDVDLLLTNTVTHDYMLGNPACTLHERLGLPRRCFSMHSDVPTYSFMMQLTLAEAMITAGRARHALLVQSCAPSRLLDPTSAIAPYFGDAATAVVVGPVSPGRGIAASHHATNGRYPRTLIASVPGGCWYDEGRAVLHIGDPWQTQRVFLETADSYKEIVDAVLAEVPCGAEDVDFLCIQQGTPWLRPVIQSHLGLSAARSVETFARVAYVFASALPLTLALAEEQALLRAGDRVLLASGGSGITYGAAVLLWGV